MKKALSVLLCVALVFGLCVPAFAEKKETPKFTNYFAIGDSITAGSGLRPWYPFGDHSVFCRDIPVSYPGVIAAKYGMTFQATEGPTYFNGAHAGMRVAEVLDALGDSEHLDDFTYNYYNTNSYGGKGALNKERDPLLYPELDKYYVGAFMDDYQNGLKNADLITIGLGNNDLMGTLLYKLEDILGVLAQEGHYEPAVQKLLEDAAKIGVPEEAFAFLLQGASTLDSIDMINDLLAKATEVLLGAYLKFASDWETLTDMILAQNENHATILVVGMYNPINSVAKTIGLGTDNIITKLLSGVFEPIVESYNYHMQYASKNHTKYVYVDMHFMEDILCEGEGHISEFIGLHPDAYGHAKMAEAILASLDKVCTHEHTMRIFARPAIGFDAGYTGDVICADCGMLIEQGTIITHYGVPVYIPTGAVYSFAALLVRQLFDLVRGLFANLPTA